MDAEWLSAIVLVVLLAGFMRLNGAPVRQILVVVGLVTVGLAATALAWDFVVRD